MTAQELAALLTGREYGKEITADEEELAKAAGLVVLFGASDDLAEVRGATNDERGAYDGTTLKVSTSGELLADWDEIDHDNEAEVTAWVLAKQAGVRTIEALWAKEGDYSWTFTTDIPHATFEIVEDGGPYCRGIVFALADINRSAA